MKDSVRMGGNNEREHRLVEKKIAVRTQGAISPCYKLNHSNN